MEKLRAKKSLGQNFLRDEQIIARIIDAVAPEGKEVIVEVGPGEGVLTELLVASGAEVVAVELDDRLVPMLRKRFSDRKNFRVIHDDVRRVHWEKELDGGVYRVVGNLPYYITSSIVRLFFEREIQPQAAFFMVQKEVAERICAPAGEMSVLSVAVQYYGLPEILFEVPRASFEPIPNVESAFLRIVPTRRYDRDADSAFFRVVRAGFAARRKTLANNLASSFHLPHETVVVKIESLGLAPMVRAQELLVEEWEKLVLSLAA